MPALQVAGGAGGNSGAARGGGWVGGARARCDCDADKCFLACVCAPRDRRRLNGIGRASADLCVRRGNAGSGRALGGCAHEPLTFGVSVPSDSPSVTPGAASSWSEDGAGDRASSLCCGVGCGVSWGAACASGCTASDCPSGATMPMGPGWPCSGAPTGTGGTHASGGGGGMHSAGRSSC